VGVCVGLCAESFADKCLLRTETHNSIIPYKESCTKLQGGEGREKKAGIPFDQKRLIQLLAWSIPQLRGSEE